MFGIKQVSNTFSVYINQKDDNIKYLYVLMKNGDAELRVPIKDNVGIIEEKHFEQWINEFEMKDITILLEYLSEIEELSNTYDPESIIEVDGKKFKKQRRLIKSKQAQDEVQGIQNFEVNGITISPFFNEKGYFVMSFNNRPLKSTYMNRQIIRIKPTNKQMLLKSIIKVRHFELKSIRLQIQSRTTGESVFSEIKPILIKKSKSKSKDFYTFQYEVEIDAMDALQELQKNISSTVDEDVWDLSFNYEQPGILDPSRVRCGMPKVVVEQLMNGQVSVKRDGIVHNLVPYFTVKGRNLSFFYNQYSPEEFETYRKVVKKGKRKPKNGEKEIWIIGERPYKAQDNGLRFFEYLRTEHPEIDAYYIIRHDSPEYENVKPFGNVINFRSKEHFELIVKADYICGTHHPDFLYPNRSKQFTKCLRAKKVFLQHGVLGVKNISGFYGKALNDFQTDLFITSSQIEKNIVLNDMDYEDYEVAITGLPRFERLFTKDVEVKKQILIIPTWRDWLTTTDRFLESDYYERYSKLINDPKLLELTTKGVEIVFCLHPNMQQFTDYFTVPEEITVIHQGDRLVQDLLKESALLVTDYSSVAFDFSFLHKPVIYYQFDRQRFLGKNPSHIDIDTMLPGVIADEGDKLIEAIWDSYEAQFEMSDHYKQLANNFIQDRDTKSNDRIFNAIQAIPKKQPVFDRLKHHQVYNAAKKKFRTNKRYFPTMKIAYKFMSKTLPPNPNLILFESGVGKQISDSPKNIYDELIKRNANYEYVWVYNGKDPIKRTDTKVIKRLSPEYYYYLAKAKYWVNNQNFPSYIKKQKNQVYIQTWHGTPLKKMQNDVEHFEGKDSGYLSRVNASVKQWDYLISPSNYATKAFRTAFNFKKEVIESGYPRNDIFYKSDEEQQEFVDLVRSEYNLPKDKKFILYAPTFRDDDVDENNKHQFSMQLDLERLHEKFGDEYMILIRTHVIVGNKLSIPPEYRDFVVNVSKYPDIQHLYLLADICMTDYSSVMFDFAHTKRPLLFFTYDLEHYKNDLRGFYMDFQAEAPGPLLKTNDEIIHALENLTEMNEEYRPKYNAFYEKYCSLEDGHAAERIVDRFFK